MLNSLSKVYSSAVVLIPPKENWASIQEIRKIYDRNIIRWMPHITMLKLLTMLTMQNSKFKISKHFKFKNE